MASDLSNPRAQLRLHNVTLFAASSVALRQTVDALLMSASEIDFAHVKLFSHEKPNNFPDSGIEWIPIAPLLSKEDYNKFILKALHQHIDTEFALCVQWDGFVVRPTAWQNTFLNFDYIGAPWPQFDDSFKVGNGGFSLRSKKLLRATVDSRVSPDFAEDLAICRHSRSILEGEYLIKFADVDTARLFSFERTGLPKKAFGFHGAFNFPKFMSGSQLTKVLFDLPTEMLTNKDLRTMLNNAIRYGKLGAFITIVFYKFTRSRRKISDASSGTVS